MKTRSNNPESGESKKDILGRQPIVSPVVPTPPQSKLPIVLLVIFLLLLFGFGGILLGKSLSVPQNISPTPTLTPKPTPTPDVTANWKTFSTASFSIKYPNDWESPQIFLQSTRIEYNFVPSNLSITEGTYYNQGLGRTRTYEEEVAAMEETTGGKMNVTVAGKATTKYINKIGESTTEESVVLQMPNKINLWIRMPFTPGTDPRLFDQILSTFEFLDEKQSLNAPQLKTADSQTPVAGICADSHKAMTVTITLNSDTPMPRCQKVLAVQRLIVVNTTNQTVTFTLGQNTLTIGPNQQKIMTQAFGLYLAPGVHFTKTSLYGGGGPEIWLQ